jgi:hypothetical protein
MRHGRIRANRDRLRKAKLTETKGVDALGYIRCVGKAPIQPPFQNVVDALRAAVAGPLADLVDSAYLYGSVARAHAVPGRSDLDVVLLLVEPPSAAQLDRIEGARLALQQRHPEVSKVDFDLGSLAEVLAAENLERWGFWLKHHCRCVAGPDRAQTFPLFRPSRSIALAVNGDFPEVLSDYARRMAAPADGVQLRVLMRQAARKAIRASNVLRAENATSWPESIADHLLQFTTSFPEWHDEIHFLAAQHDQPQAEPREFAQRLMRFADWLARQR